MHRLVAHVQLFQMALASILKLPSSRAVQSSSCKRPRSSRSHYVTESAYILENAAGGTKIIVESLFSAAVFGAHGTDNTVLDAQCRIEYKPQPLAQARRRVYIPPLG